MFRFWEQPNLEESGGAGTGGGALPAEKEEKVERDEFSRENENVVEQEETIRRTKVAEMIAEPKMRDRYLDRMGFEREMEKTRESLLDFLEREISENNELRADLLDFFRSEHFNNDLECLTLIRAYGDFYRPDLYKEELYRHSLGVFRIALESYSSVLSIRAGGGEASLGLGGQFLSEMGGRSPKAALVEFFRAILMHDLGKISIPEFVVYNPVTDRGSWEFLKEKSGVAETEREVSHNDPAISFGESSLRIDDILFRFSGEPGFPVSVSSGKDGTGIFSSEERKSILSWLEGKRINPKIPVGILIEMDKDAGFSREEKLKRLAEANINPKTPFEEVLNWHEHQSEVLVQLIENNSILESIVGSHHNKAHIIRYLVSSESSGNELARNWLSEHGVAPRKTESAPPMDTISSYLHIADVWEAIRAKRSYKDPLPIDQSLSILVSETLREGLNPKVAAFFIDFQVGRNFGGETSNDRMGQWGVADISPKFKAMVKEFLIREEVWVP